jgi:signal transduction histidine kinase
MAEFHPRRFSLQFAALVVALVGAFVTFAVMSAVGSSDPVGASVFMIWIALVAVEFGIVAGVAAGVSCLLLYLGGRLIDQENADWLIVLTRGVPFVLLGVGLGLVGRRLRVSERRIRDELHLRQALINSTVDAICLTDRGGRILIANSPMREAVAELALPTRGPIHERLLAVADRFTDPDRFRTRISEIAANPDSPSRDEFELAASGRVFQGFTSPVIGEAGEYVGRVWTLREVTEERELARLKDEFVATVSHELRTPLTSIAGFLSLLREDSMGLDETQERYLRIVERNAERLRQLVDDLLLIAQVDAGRLTFERQRLSLGALVQGCADASRPEADVKDIELTVDAPSELMLTADGARLGQAIDNVIRNAIKFAPERGVVDVRVFRENGCGVIAVADNGVGIPLREQDRIFERFFRASTATRGSIPGTGLGLAITKSIVDAHDGSIAIESSVGSGTTVTIALPMRS